MVKDEKEHSGETTVIKVGAKPVHYMQALGIYYSNLQVKRFQRISVAERVAHFWAERPASYCIFIPVCVMGFRDFPDEHLWSSKLVRDASQISVDKDDYR